MKKSAQKTLLQAGSALFLLTLAGSSRAADPEFPSQWRAGAVVVDGDADEWAGKLVPVPGTQVVLGVQNDGSFLYLCLKTSDDAAKKRIQALGVNFYLDGSGKADRSFGVRYPAAPPPPPARQGNAPPEEGGQTVRVRREASAGELQILGRDAEGGGRMKVASAAPLAAAMGEKDGVLVLELKVPLAFSVETPFAIQTAPGKTIALGVEGALPDKELRSGGMRGGRGGEGSGGGVSVGRGGVSAEAEGGSFRAGPGGASVGFGSGGRGGPGGRGGQGPAGEGRPSEQSAGTPVKKWFRVQLSSAPAPAAAPAAPAGPAPRPRPSSGGRSQATTTSIAGGATRCFFTAHWSVARTIALRYFSGKPGGSVRSSRIFAISFVSASRSQLIESPSPPVSIFRSWQNRSA